LEHGFSFQNLLRKNNFYNSFDYQGGNLLVLVATNYGGSGGGTNPTIRYSSSTDNHQYWTEDGSAPTGTGTRTSNRPNIRISYYSNVACTGTPTGGTASLTPSSGNAGSTFIASATGATFGSGITYQWQKNVGGWTDIAGETSATSTITAKTVL